MSRALLPGTYDPPTLGHVDIIRRAALAFDEVTAAIFVNSEKKTLFSADQRLEMLTASISGIPNARAVFADGMTADYARKNNCSAIVKGVRNVTDYDYECMIAAVNRKVGGIETLFLPANGGLAHICSTTVREMIKYGIPLDGWLPDEVIALIAKYKN